MSKRDIIISVVGVAVLIVAGLLVTLRFLPLERDLINAAGERYQGVMKNGRMQGSGRLTYAPDDAAERVSYEGDFVDDLRHGRGTMIWRNGQKYEGQ